MSRTIRGSMTISSIIMWMAAVLLFIAMANTVYIMAQQGRVYVTVLEASEMLSITGTRGSGETIESYGCDGREGLAFKSCITSKIEDMLPNMNPKVELNTNAESSITYDIKIIGGKTVARPVVVL